MYCSNQSSMATLLQQKSFMKNLTNGANNVVVVNGTDDNQTTTMVATSAAMAAVPGSASRMLLPHETLVLPTTHPQPLIHQQTTVNNIFTTTHSPAASISSNSFNSQFINHLQSTHHLSTQQLFGTSSSQRIATTTIPTTTFQSQYTNADVNAIFRPTAASTANNTSIVTMQSYASSHQQQQLPHLAISASSLVYVNGTQQNSVMVPKEEPSEQHHHSQTHHYLQQTVTESQTANTITTTDARTTVSDGCGGRDTGTIIAGTGEQLATATATDAPDIATETTTDHVDEQQQEQEAESEIDIIINNVVCSFSVRCHLSLRDIALKGFNVEFRRENGMVTMKLRRPYTTASIWSSGKITCTGATSEDQAKVAARRYSRCLQKLGFNVRFRNFRIVNVLGTCSMPWGIMIVNFSEKYKKDASYEPELHPGVTYKLMNPKATLKIFSTGSITVTAASVAFVQAAIEHIFPLVYEFRKKRTQQEKLEMLKQPTFDPDQLIEEECDIERPAKLRRDNNSSEDEDDDADVFDDDEDVHSGTGDDTKAIHTRKNRRRMCKSRYSSYRCNGRKRPAGKADNDPTEDAMYVSDDGVDDMIESDED